MKDEDIMAKIMLGNGTVSEESVCMQHTVLVNRIEIIGEENLMNVIKALMDSEYKISVERDLAGVYSIQYVPMDGELEIEVRIK